MPVTRPRLSRELIVRTALALADEQGIDGVTLANVAGALSCKAPSLYNHVDGLDDLLDELAIVATADFANALRDSVVAKVGEDAVRAYARAWRHYVTTHPARYLATLRTRPPSATDNAVEAGMTIPVGAILATIGIAETDLADAGRALRSGLHGFTHLELANIIGPDPDASFEVVVDVLIAGLRART